MKAFLLTDVFDTDSSCLKRSAMALRSVGFGQSKSDEASAVYVSHQGEAQMAFSGVSLPVDKKRTEESLAKRVQKAGALKLKIKPQVIYEDTLSLKSAVDTLLAQAKKQSVGLVVLSTQARKGFARFLLGSFAETLIHRSSIDLLILNPKAKVRAKTKSMVVAIDLEKGVEQLVRETAELARKLDATVTYVHVPSPSYSVHFKGQDPSVAKYRKAVDRKVAQLDGLARSLGAKASVQIAGRWQAVSDVVLQVAKKQKADLIVIKAKSGSLATLMLGSVARSVVRKSEVPVMVVRR